MAQPGRSFQPRLPAGVGGFRVGAFVGAGPARPQSSSRQFVVLARRAQRPQIRPHIQPVVASITAFTLPAASSAGANGQNVAVKSVVVAAASSSGANAQNIDTPNHICVGASRTGVRGANATTGAPARVSTGVSSVGARSQCVASKSVSGVVCATRTGCDGSNTTSKAASSVGVSRTGCFGFATNIGGRTTTSATRSGSRSACTVGSAVPPIPTVVSNSTDCEADWNLATSVIWSSSV